MQMLFNIWKIDKVRGIRIKTIYKTRTWDKLSISALPFFRLTMGSFKFFKHFQGFRRSSKNCSFKPLWKQQKLRRFTGLKPILVCQRDHDLIWEETVSIVDRPRNVFFFFHIILVDQAHFCTVLVLAPYRTLINTCLIYWIINLIKPPNKTELFSFHCFCSLFLAWRNSRRPPSLFSTVEEDRLRLRFLLISSTIDNKNIW